VLVVFVRNELIPRCRIQNLPSQIHPHPFHNLYQPILDICNLLRSPRHSLQHPCFHVDFIDRQITTNRECSPSEAVILPSLFGGGGVSAARHCEYYSGKKSVNLPCAAGGPVALSILPSSGIQTRVSTSTSDPMPLLVRMRAQDKGSVVVVTPALSSKSI
jgi:hypothetical protein